MKFAYVSTRVRDMPGAIIAIRALEAWQLATLVLQMIGQIALEGVSAAAFVAGEASLPVASLAAVNVAVGEFLRSRRGRCRRRGDCRRI